MLTVEEALKNIVVVVRNSKMNADEHDALRDSIQLVAQRCELTDKLEKAAEQKQAEEIEADRQREADDNDKEPDKEE